MAYAPHSVEISTGFLLFPLLNLVCFLTRMAVLTVAKHVVLSRVFRRFLLIVGCLFVLLTAFLSLNPDPFLRFGYMGVFVYNLVGSGLLLIPVVSHRLNLFFLILFSALGNVANTSLNYFIGSNSTTVVTKIPHVDKAKTFLKHFGFIGVYTLAIVPLPIDLNGLLSGYLGVPYRWYIVVNFLGKVTIFLLVGLGILSFSNLFRYN